MRTLSPTATQSLNASETAEVWLTLLTLTHATLATPLRFVDNNLSVLSRGNLFVAAPFQVELPAQTGTTPGEARLVIDNIDREIVQAIRSIDSPISVLLEVILASQPSTVELSFAGLTMRETDWDALTVTGVLRAEDLMSEPITVQMTPARFPGLF